MSTEDEIKIARSLLSAEGESRSFFVSRVHYVDTDAMGVMHHANYIPLLERARVAWLDQTAFPYRMWSLRGLHLPLSRVEIDYKSSCAFDDVLGVEMVMEFSPMRFEIHYCGYRLDRSDEFPREGVIPVPASLPVDRAFEARTTHYFLDQKEGIQRPSQVLLTLQSDLRG